MISKNLFLVSLKEDNKRRIGVWIISLITFFLTVPASLVLLFSNTRAQWEMYSMNYTLVEKHEILTEMVLRHFSLNNWISAMVFAVAIVCGIQGFIYLHNKRKIDFYHCLPVSRKQRFFTIWVNGILIYLIPLVVSVLMGFIVIAVQGVMSVAVFTAACKMVLFSLLLYLSVYHIAILPVMLTGHWFSLFSGIGVLLLYEMFVRMVSIKFKEIFYQTYSYYGETIMPVLSPITLYTKLAEAVEAGGAAGIAGVVVKLSLFIVATGAMAYIAYHLRPAEAAGKSMAFSWMKTPIKFLIAIPVTLILSLELYEMTYENIGFSVFGLIIGSILICCAMEVIYEFDIKAIFARKKHILITAFVSVIVFVIFSQDLFGYDEYIPDNDKIESAVLLNTNNIYHPRIDENFNYISAYEYAMSNMYLSDVEVVTELASRKTVNETDMERNYQYHFLAYRLKSGRTVYREIILDYDDEVINELMTGVMQSQEYQNYVSFFNKEYYKSYIKGYENNYFKTKGAITYSNGVWHETISAEMHDRLLEAYNKDLEKITLDTFSQEYPVGSIIIAIEMTGKQRSGAYYNGGRRIEEATLPVYGEFSETLRVLESADILEKIEINAQDIDSVNIRYYNNDNYETTYTNQPWASSDYTQTLISTSEAEWILIDDPNKIAEIFKSIYPENLSYGTGYRRHKYFEDNYEIIVTLKSKVQEGYSGISTGFLIKSGEVPQFVKEEFGLIK